MTRIKCFKLECCECGVVGTAQVWINKDLEISHGRVRHYQGINEDKRPCFIYHKQSREYLVQKLQSKVIESINSSGIDQVPTDQAGIVDRKLKEFRFLFKERRAGSLARLGHLLDVQKVTGSNPVRPTNNSTVFS